jgi:hypothetical protein
VPYQRPNRPTFSLSELADKRGGLFESTGGVDTLGPNLWSFVSGEFAIFISNIV